MSANTSELARMLEHSNGVSSLVTPDFRFFEYAYPRQDLTSAYLTQDFGPSSIGPAKLDSDAIAAFRKLKAAPGSWTARAMEGSTGPQPLRPHT